MVDRTFRVHPDMRRQMFRDRPAGEPIIVPRIDQAEIDALFAAWGPASRASAFREYECLMRDVFVTYSLPEAPQQAFPVVLIATPAAFALLTFIAWCSP